MDLKKKVAEKLIKMTRISRESSSNIFYTFAYGSDAYILYKTIESNGIFRIGTSSISSVSQVKQDTYLSRFRIYIYILFLLLL